MTDPEKAALHAYRDRVQLEAVELGRALNALAADAGDAVDRNGPATAYYAGMHSAYLAARGMAERLLLVAEEAAGKVAAAPVDGDLHEAQACTPDYQRRHVTEAKALGVWRWRGLQKHRERITAMVHDAYDRGMVIDFGGHDGPLGMGSIVVDTLAQVTSLAAFSADAVAGIFTSHTLEHIEYPSVVLREMRAKLMPGGWLIAHVPAWTCARWRAGVHGSERHGDHRWTFGLDDEAPAGVDRETYASVTRMIEAAGFEVSDAEYCGDDSIIVFATRGA